MATLLTWAWTFGDGNASSEQNPSHTYGAAATYTVSLTVTDDDGAPSSVSKQVTVSVPGSNASPVADFTFSCTNLSCGFTDRSTDADGNVLAWSWSFGDGATSTAQNSNRTYASGGTYNVTLTVTDDDGATHQHSASVTVTAPPSAAVFHHADDLRAHRRGEALHHAPVVRRDRQLGGSLSERQQGDDHPERRAAHHGAQVQGHRDMAGEGVSSREHDGVLAGAVHHAQQLRLAVNDQPA